MTTDTNQFSVDGNVGVFTIDYRFGHEKHDLTMPLRAVRKESDDATALTYDVVDGEGRSGKGKAYAVILSDAPLKNNHYMTLKGFAHTFRLLVLYERDPSEANMFFRAQVTALPFAFTNVQNLSLNDSELRKYTTEPLPLLKGVSVQIKSSEIR
jgi:hypothetical protein